MIFRYPVYNPHLTVLNCASDWYFEHQTQDLALVLGQPYRVAAVRVMFDDPNIYSYDPATSKLDLSQFDLVVLSDAEYLRSDNISRWADSKGIKQWLLAKGGIDPNDAADPRILYRPYWLRRFLTVNSPQDSDATYKPFMFDCLMGARRPHRDYFMMAATQSGLIQHSIVTYRNVFPGGVIDSQTTEFAAIFPKTKVNWPYVSPNLNPAWEVAPTVDNTISFISPVEIYRRCRYSVVTETLGNGEQFFFSEKTMKALFNHRVFVMFGNAYFLQRLKQLGFETFGSLIDETYDNNVNAAERFQLAMQQVHSLSWKNPEHVYAQVKDVLAHNHHHMYQLVEQNRRAMLKLLQEHIPAKHWS